MTWRVTPSWSAPRIGRLTDYPPGLWDHLRPEALRALGFEDIPPDPPLTSREELAVRAARRVSEAFPRGLVIAYDLPSGVDGAVDQDGVTYVSYAAYQRLLAEVEP